MGSAYNGGKANYAFVGINRTGTHITTFHIKSVKQSRNYVSLGLLYVSADGTRQVRIGDSDITGKHGGGSHINFETLVDNPWKPDKKII